MIRQFAAVWFSVACVIPVPFTQVCAEPLPNGIERVAEFTPPAAPLSDEPMPVPYLKHRLDVVPIDLGRQLLVDDFLIETNDLRRTFHAPKYHAKSPVLQPEMPWEVEPKNLERRAAPYSDGVWYDASRKEFRLWYQAADGRTCLATSADGIAWTRPKFDIEPGTNVVLTSQNNAFIRDTNTVWIDGEATDPARRYVLFSARYARSPYRMSVRTSSDGVHWSEELAVSARSWDRSSAFYNPFRKVWVASVRGHDHVAPAPVHRLRCYFEGRTPEAAVGWKQPCDDVAKGNLLPHDLIPWVAADRLDARHPDPRFKDLPPQLYNLDVFPYESLLVGLFTIWQGPQNEVCKELGIHKRNEVFVGFTRDGFHWHRPNRERFLPVGDNPDTWNAGNVQSAGGGCCVVGDRLHFYCSGRNVQHVPVIGTVSTTSTGLATLRRDGFASLDAPPGGGVMTTRPLRFSGKRLFVNASPGSGELRVELLDQNGQVVPGYGHQECQPITGDTTRAEVVWAGDRRLPAQQGQPARFRFHLTGGSLWSFWVTDDPRGASGGYMAAGGPEFTSPRDLPRE